MRDELSNLFTDSVLHEPTTGYDLYGTPTYGPAVARVVRVIRRQRSVVGKSGDVAVSRAQVWFRDAVTIDLDDRFTLPEGTVNSAILAVDGSPDDSGELYTKVYL
jgi:hypothetical protein